MRKKVLTRKGKALRWLLAAVVLGALAWVLLPWNFTAKTAHRQDVKRYVADTQIIYEADSPLGQKLLLSLSDHVIGMGAYKRDHLLHWLTGNTRIVEREPERPFAVGQISEYIHNQDPDKREELFYVFGVIHDESLTEIQINFDAITGGHDQQVCLTKADWLTTETGEQFFVCALEAEIGNWSRAGTVTGYRADGSGTATLDLFGAGPFWND